MIGACIATLLVTTLVWYMERRESRIRGARSGDKTEQLEEREWNKPSGIHQGHENALWRRSDELRLPVNYLRREYNLMYIS